MAQGRSLSMLYLSLFPSRPVCHQLGKFVSLTGERCSVQTTGEASRQAVPFSRFSPSTPVGEEGTGVSGGECLWRHRSW